MVNQIRSNMQIVHSEKVPETKDYVGRFLEEVIELSLASGMSAGEILNHVSDVLHNEALKAGVYPSQLSFPPSDKSAILTEMADCDLFFNTIKELYFTNDEKKSIEQNSLQKSFHFRRLKENGELKFTPSGTFYRKGK